MAFNSNAGKQQFIASASQTAFSFNFAIFHDTDLRVYLTPSGSIADDTADILILSTDYTVSINGTIGGTLTLTSGATLNDTITLVRALPVSREIDYATNGDLFADILDLDQDYQTYLVQDSRTQLERAIIAPESIDNVSLNIPAPSADAYLKWNATADALENDTSLPNNVILSQASADEATAQAVVATTKASEASASATLAEGYANSINPATLVSKDSDTGAAYIPSGTTAQRPVTPASGYMRFNTTLSSAEVWNGTMWTPVGGGATGGGADTVFVETSYTVTQDYTITAGKSAITIGDANGNVTVNDGVTITIPDGASWVVIGA